MSIIYAEGEEPDNIKLIKGLEINQQSKEIVLRFTNGNRKDVMVLKPRELWLAIFNSQFYDIHDPRIPIKNKEEFKNQQKLMAEGKGLTSVEIDAPEIAAQTILKHWNSPAH